MLLSKKILQYIKSTNIDLMSLCAEIGTKINSTESFDRFKSIIDDFAKPMHEYFNQLFKLEELVSDIEIESDPSLKDVIDKNRKEFSEDMDRLKIKVSELDGLLYNLQSNSYSES